jgi:hypothetical protein
MNPIVAGLEQHERNTPVTSAEIRIAFEFRHSFEEFPTALVAFTPVLAVNAVANLAGMGQTAQGGLEGKTKRASNSVRPVAVDDLEQLEALPLRRLDFRAQPGACLFHAGQPILEIDGFDGHDWSRSGVD